MLVLFTAPAAAHSKQWHISFSATSILVCSHHVCLLQLHFTVMQSVTDSLLHVRLCTGRYILAYTL
jgi:hypothetical protein